MAQKRKSRKKRAAGRTQAKNGQTAPSAMKQNGADQSSLRPDDVGRVSKREQRRIIQAKAARMKRIRAAGLVLILLLAAAGTILWRNAGVVPADELQAALGPNLDGPADAPVRIVEFGDFGCPSCRAWHNAGIREQVRVAFGDQVSFEFRHFPVITAQSPKAAEAAQCAGEQGAFWQYHDYIYEQTPQGALGSSDLKSYAAALGLDESTFDTCLDSGRFQQYVTEDMQAAFDAGARGTPSFYIDGQPISFSLDGMSAAIQQALDS